MEGCDLYSLSIDELWKIYVELTEILSRRTAAERAKLEERLRKIEAVNEVTTLDRVRRRYPKVSPKYENPKNPAETWSGRGKQPRWVKAQLLAGMKLQDFVIGR
jgi:DNA-binding protein H-NS